MTADSKKILCSLSVLFVVLSIHADIWTWRRSNELRNDAAIREYNSYENQAARAKAASEQLWRQQNPWWVNQDWRNTTNLIGQLEFYMERNQRELFLLQRSQSNLARQKQLEYYLANQNKAIGEARQRKLVIESQWRLQEFYRTNR